MTVLLLILSMLHGCWYLTLEQADGAPVHLTRADGNDWIDSWDECQHCVSLCGPDEVYVVTAGTLDGETVWVVPIDEHGGEGWEWTWTPFCDPDVMTGPIVAFNVETDWDLDTDCVLVGVDP